MDQLNDVISGQQPTPGFDTPISGELGFSVNIPAGIGATASQTVIVDATFDFVWRAKSYDSLSSDWTVLIEYPDGSKVQGDGTAVKGSLAFGKAPFALPVRPPYRCRTGSRIKFTFTNRTAVAIAVDVLLSGQFYKQAK